MITRSPRPQSGYYILDRRISDDKRLGWAARGLLIYLLSKPDNWQISVAALIKQTADSPSPSARDGVYSLLDQLIVAGYLRRDQARDGSGKMAGASYTVFESPDTAEPEAVQTENLGKTVDPPLTAEPDAAETTLMNNESKQRTSSSNKRGASASANPITLPDWMPLEPWRLMLEHRRLNRWPCTQHALKLLIDRLERFRGQGHDVTQMLTEARECGWRGVFPPKGQFKRREPVDVVAIVEKAERIEREHGNFWGSR
jgi:hypothetical protein